MWWKLTSHPKSNIELIAKYASGVDDYVEGDAVMIGTCSHLKSELHRAIGNVAKYYPVSGAYLILLQNGKEALLHHSEFSHLPCL